MPRSAHSRLRRRVSSAATTSAPESSAASRGGASPAWPIGVPARTRTPDMGPIMSGSRSAHLGPGGRVAERGTSEANRDLLLLIGRVAERGTSEAYRGLTVSGSRYARSLALAGYSTTYGGRGALAGC